jgi:hypothetical protein
MTSTRQKPLLNPFIDKDRYTFSDYFDSILSAQDIARGFGYTLEEVDLHLGCRLPDSTDLSWLQRTLQVNQNRSRLVNEFARRAAIVSPILHEVCEIADLRVSNEYGISVSPHLTGIVDYWIEAEVALLIVEAKESDLVRGMKQLIPELIASHYWSQSPVPTLFGAVTDGERWQFARLDRPQAQIRQDRRVYRLNDLEALVGTLVAIVQPK